MKRNETQNWRPFFHLLCHSSIPWHWYLINFILGLIISMTTVRLPQMTGAIMQGEIFDKGLIGTYIGITLFSMALSFSSTVLGAWIGFCTDRNLQGALWNHILYLPLTIYQKFLPSTFITRITQDTSGISSGISTCIGVVTNTWTIYLMMKTVYEMNRGMVFAMTAVVPWLIAVSIVTGRYTFKASRRAQEQFSDFTAVIAERLVNLKSIKIHGEEQTEFEKGQAAARLQYKAEIYRAKVNLFSQPFIYSSEAFLKTFVLIYGGMLISRGELTSGEFITLYMYLEMIPIFAIQYIFAYQAVKATQGSSMRAGEILLGQTEALTAGDPLKDIRHDISFREVSFTYNGRPALRRATFTIPAGRTTAIIGPSGSGKTTVLNLLERFYETDEGEILFLGKNIRSIRLKDWREKLCCVPQNSPLLSGTVSKNLTYGLKKQIGNEDLELAARQACAYGFITQLPKQFQSETGEMGSRFSAGERQRLALTRALARNPEFLLLDEAVCNLDSIHAGAIRQSIQKLMKDRTCVLVTHDMETACNADHIVVLDRGTVCGEGSHETLYKTCDTYRKLFDIQLKSQEIS